MTDLTPEQVALWAKRLQLADKALKTYWLSWWHEVTLMSSFELHTPWWTTGRRDFAKESYALSVVAAVRAHSFDEAKALIVASYDEIPALEWRFIEEKPARWAPFCERFPRREWMQW